MTESVQIHDIALRDLESLLRKKLGKELVLVTHSTRLLLPMGENYGSTMLQVDALVVRSPGEEQEELHLVAKMPPATDFQRKWFDSPFTFRKEAFLYEKIVPAYQSLEREFGVKADEIFDVVPEIYGARFSLRSDDEFDDDAVILLDNLKFKGYYTANRQRGLDMEHAKAAIVALARFHALGIAMKQYKPDFFEILKVRSKCLSFPKDNSFDDVRDAILRLMHGDPIISKHYNHLEVIMKQDPEGLWTSQSTEPWSTIVHSDFWINNIMFRNDPHRDQVVDVKFVDFQNYLLMSPLRELIFFSVTNCNNDVMASGFDELLDCYYEIFVTVLKRMNCDLEPFTRDKFDERIKLDAFKEFPHAPFMLKIMTTEMAKDFTINKIETLMRNEASNPLMLERLRGCVQIYVKKGWLDKTKIS